MFVVTAVSKINKVYGNKVKSHKGVEKFIQLPNGAKLLLFQDFERAGEIFPDTDMDCEVTKKVSGMTKVLGRADAGKSDCFWLV